MIEEWKPIKGFEKYYLVSNFGNIKSLDRTVFQKHKDGGKAKHIYKGKSIKQRKQKNGYFTVDLHEQGTFKRFLVHRLVAEHFLEKMEGKDYVNHLDNNPLNNRYDNLEWCTQSENIQYAYDNGRKKPPHQKKVCQYDLEGNLIKIWDSGSQAGRELKICSPNINKVCRGERKKAGGYLWKFAQ